MAILGNVTVRSAEQIWSSPDGKMTIFSITLEHDGKQFKAKTYSKTVATVGWSGDVESYEKEGRQGPETFVKQPQKAGGFGGGGRPMADPYTMYLSYAKDLAIASVQDGKFDDKVYTELLEAVEAGGAQLYGSRPDAKPEKSKQTFSDGSPIPEELPL